MAEQVLDIPGRVSQWPRNSWTLWQ